MARNNISKSPFRDFEEHGTPMFTRYKCLKLFLSQDNGDKLWKRQSNHFAIEQ